MLLPSLPTASIVIVTILDFLPAVQHLVGDLGFAAANAHEVVPWTRAVKHFLFPHTPSLLSSFYKKYEQTEQERKTKKGGAELTVKETLQGKAYTHGTGGRSQRPDGEFVSDLLEDMGYIPLPCHLTDRLGNNNCTKNNSTRIQ
jgi:hypothetical protein